MSMARIEIRANRMPFIRDTIELRIAEFVNTSNGVSVFMAPPIQLKKLSEDEMSCDLPASLSISPESAQQFMDELWRVGIRPTEGAGSVGQMAATERHLEDMRKLVFKEAQS